MNNSIESLIPHRFPFLFVDEIVSASTEEIIGIKTFNKKKDEILTGSFPNSGFIPGMILIESMAQCGGAGIKKLGLANGFFGLVSIDKVRFFKGVTYDTEVKYCVKNLRVSDRLIKQEGIAYVKNEPVAEASWICAKISS
ncbi:3-hydroxyacyl-[acyl-carrier-protein] dehydratase [Algoriphagus iocasae]|uniref:3-hydroxyacyl-[acyl-carrier-protein] dehydratase n=1 Tax=Algoriphagus iocasae TaxID=1836499 RepID=A0A841MWS7_9BACT|nr:3-hydroxyacyl-ACP dehydratase FabZ family protein [Algoriphagus iocasae]MBB6326461.1 3-hydroxyacyl-[acyl-carrier-protein] dehydratase [Algoriphagus iocasae]